MEGVRAIYTLGHDISVLKCLRRGITTLLTQFEIILMIMIIESFTKKDLQSFLK